MSLRSDPLQPEHMQGPPGPCEARGPALSLGQAVSSALPTSRLQVRLMLLAPGHILRMNLRPPLHDSGISAEPKPAALQASHS